MPTINVLEIKIKTTGFAGAPGWTTLYFDADDTTTYANSFRAAKAILLEQAQIEPTQWSGQVLSPGRVLLASTGVLENFTNGPDDGTMDVVAGVNGSSYGAGVAGMVLAWTTAGVNRNRRVRGRTFLVPLSSTMYEADGTLNNTKINALPAALVDFVTGVNKFGIWSRPKLGVGGAFFPATSVRITDRASFLSSRRG